MDKDKKFSDMKINYEDVMDMDEWRLWEGGNSKKPFHLEGPHAKNDRWLSVAERWYGPLPKDNQPRKDDMVDHPYHYTVGKFEAIDVIEDAITEAPTPQFGFLQAQVLKYVLRLWHKIDAKEDAEKARWYLNRLIDSLN